MPPADSGTHQRQDYGSIGRALNNAWRFTRGHNGCEILPNAHLHFQRQADEAFVGQHRRRDKFACGEAMALQQDCPERLPADDETCQTGRITSWCQGKTNVE